MGGEEIDTTKKRKAESKPPPDGYVCRLCSTPGHWIQVCPTKKTGSKKQKVSDHVPVPGQDPSPEDIERAKELQLIPPPKCFCGVLSRLNKVKRSKEGGDGSRAIGKYFFFCSKKRDDETQCRFARPVEMELKKQKSIGDRAAKTKASSGGAAKDDKQADSKKVEKSKPTKLVCKFFAKTGSCKKGMKCEFSHDVQAKKEPVKDLKKEKLSESKKDEEEEDESSSDDSSSSSSSSDDSSSDDERD